MDGSRRRKMIESTSGRLWEDDDAFGMREKDRGRERERERKRRREECISYCFHVRSGR